MSNQDDSDQYTRRSSGMLHRLKISWGGGDEAIRTPDLCSAIAALCQLSYIPDQTKFYP